PSSAQKHPNPSTLELGPQKKLLIQDPLVHRSCHFGCAVHTFCSVQTLVTNGIIHMGGDDMESLAAAYWKEFAVFRELLKMVPGLKARLMESSEDDVITISDLIQKDINGACADDMEGMKEVGHSHDSAIIDWITPRGQSLTPHILQKAKSGRGFNHEQTGALLCPAGLDWNNMDLCVVVCPWCQPWVTSVFLYANFTYDLEDPWNGLLWSGLLVLAFKHIFTSPSSVDQEPKATHSGNAHLHGMWSVTKVSIAYVTTQ
ncbi:hypothetical protein SCLCIDRAFT_83603, partial [Scleroderma citrinum Foug A]